MDDLHSRWAHRWVNPKAKAYQSTIQGWGVIAESRISAGEVVGVLGGSIVHRSEITEYRKIMTQVGIQVDDNFFIVPTSRAELEQYGVFNHSCTPNAGFSNSISLVAMRDIAAGEELTFDYAFCETYFDVFNCNCKSAACRKTIKPDDWKKPEIYDRYRNYYSPYLREKLKDL